MIHLYKWDVSVLADDDMFERYYKRLSANRREKTDRLRFKADKLLSVGAGILLDVGLALYGCKESTMEYALAENGKPYFANEPSIHYNISHSGTVALVALSESPVGCDVEMIREAKLDIAKRFFHPEECIPLAKEMDPSERNLLFYRIWTLKESFVKTTGRGLTQPLNLFCVRPGNDRVQAEGDGAENYSFGEIFDVPGYCVSWCSAKKDDRAVMLSADGML